MANEINELKKLCRDCGEIKPNEQFVRNHVCKNGLDSLCLLCNYRRVREWREAGKRRSATESRRAYAKNPEAARVRQDLRRKRIKQATPQWLTHGQRMLVLNYEAIARLRRFLTGKHWHIDHIVPFGGENVCGLNVPWNMRVVTGKENWTKANKLVI